ncbi:hypothetical protein Unana1_07218 [Umbelopsis nana]
MKLERMAPINLMFLTRPINDMTVTRIKQLESFYSYSRFIRFLLRKGVHPIGLFTVSTAALALVVRRLYRRSTYLVINTLGVAYPAWRCLKLIRQAELQTKPSEQQQNIEEYKSWLTYWLLYGSLQVLDNWAPLLNDLMPYYNIYKIAILYWAQNPQSKGATTLYNILRPIPTESSTETSPSDTPQPYTLRKSVSIETIVKRPAEAVTIPYETHSMPLLTDMDDEELTLTISSGQGYGLMNGYTPSLSSEREEETEEDEDPEEITRTRPESVAGLSTSPKYNMLMHVTNDTPAW